MSDRTGLPPWVLRGYVRAGLWALRREHDLVVREDFDFDQVEPYLVAALYPPHDGLRPLLAWRPDLADDARYVLLREARDYLNARAAGEVVGTISHDTERDRPVALLTLTVDPPSGQG